MNLLKPKKLKTGDTIGFLSASGNIEDTDKLECAKKYFEEQGFMVKISDTYFKTENYFSGSAEARTKALMEFFIDESISAIIAIRGGYGALRVINKIDYDIIKNNPKIFVGFSDATAFSLMFYKKTGLVTFSGPMACTDFSGVVDAITEKSFFNTLEGNEKSIPIDTPEGKVYSNGNAQGILWGGNLATIASLAGLDFIPDEKFILFTEDTSEPVYKIDRMFTQLLNITQFKNNLAGIVLGDFDGLDSQKYFDDFFVNLGEELNIPIQSGLKIGHGVQKLAIPVGVKCSFDTAQNRIDILEDYLTQ